MGKIDKKAMAAFMEKQLAAARSRAIQETGEMSILIVALSLNTEFGFSTKRLDKLFVK